MSEPGAERKRPEGGPADGEALPADVAALLDAFSEPAEAIERAQPPAPAVPPAAPAPPAAEPEVVIDVEEAVDAPRHPPRSPRTCRTPCSRAGAGDP